MVIFLNLLHVDLGCLFANNNFFIEEILAVQEPRLVEDLLATKLSRRLFLPQRLIIIQIILIHETFPTEIHEVVGLGRGAPVPQIILFRVFRVFGGGFEGARG